MLWDSCQRTNVNLTTSLYPNMCVCLFSGTPRGQINVLAEEVQDSKFTVTMQLAASKLDKKDFFGKVGNTVGTG